MYRFVRRTRERKRPVQGEGTENEKFANKRKHKILSELINRVYCIARNVCRMQSDGRQKYNDYTSFVCFFHGFLMRPNRSGDFISERTFGAKVYAGCPWSWYDKRRLHFSRCRNISGERCVYFFVAVFHVARGLLFAHQITQICNYTAILVGCAFTFAVPHFVVRLLC